MSSISDILSNILDFYFIYILISGVILESMRSLSCLEVILGSLLLTMGYSFLNDFRFVFFIMLIIYINQEDKIIENANSKGKMKDEGIG